jgi:Arc/MetJ-type ribon-helix-helix transcriptional regulator
MSSEIVREALRDWQHKRGLHGEHLKRQEWPDAIPLGAASLDHLGNSHAHEQGGRRLSNIQKSTGKG